MNPSQEPLPPAQSLEPLYASFGSRAIAIIIDGLIMSFVLAIITSILKTGLDSTSGTYGILSFLVGEVVWIGYNIYFLTTTGSTLGKRIMRISVVKEGTFAKLTSEEVIIRSLFYLLNYIFLIDILIALFTEKSQTIHDLVVRSVVIKERS